MKKGLSIFLAVLMLVSLCACGSTADKTAYSYASQAAPAEAAYEEYGDFGFSESEITEANGSEASDAPEVDPEKIIYSADASIETTAFDEAVSALEALVKQYGGFVESSSVNGSNYYNMSRGYSNSRRASYTIRIPSQHFSTVMSSLSTIGNVPYTHVYTENITSQYYDVQARLQAYQTEEQSLLALMEKAESVEDIITVQSELTDVRYRIESLQSTLKNWDRQVSYSTVSVSIEEVSEYTPEAKISYGRRLVLAAKDGIETVIDFLSDLLIFLLEALPTLIVLALIVFGIVKLIKHLRRSKKPAKGLFSRRKSRKASDGDSSSSDAE